MRKKRTCTNHLSTRHKSGFFMISEYCFLSFCLPSTIFSLFPVSFSKKSPHEMLIFNLLTGVRHLT